MLERFLSYPLIDERQEPDAFQPVVRPEPEPAQPSASASSYDNGNWVDRDWNGSKWTNGFGPTQILWTDYWTLRARSAQLFKQNLYARGLIRRLVNNEINTGLHLEATPEEKLLGYAESDLTGWTEEVENRFALWGKEPTLCDHFELQTFGALQEATRREALISGDILVVLQQDQRTGLPRVRLISGGAVQTPLMGRVSLARGHRIEHGVEIDSVGHQVAYWVLQRDGSFKRIPAWGEKSGRRIAWLVYGTDKRLDDVRGEPLLSLVLQSLNEIDRYRDSVQRKALINSIIAMWIERTEDKPASKPFSGAGGPVRKTVETSTDTGVERRHLAFEAIPGLSVDKLSVGEKLHAHASHGTDEKFGDFEAAVIRAIAWGNGVPPEILQLSFGSNYSASQAAINEFKMVLNLTRTRFGEAFCQPIYVEWLISEVLNQHIDAPGLLEAWRDPSKYVEFTAWVSADWSGHVKPAVDLSKLVGGYEKMTENGFIDRDRSTRELTGLKFSKVIKKLARENQALFEANKPLAELQRLMKATGGANKQQSAQDDDPESINREDDDNEEARAGAQVIPIRER